MSWPVLPHGFLGSQATGDNDTYQISRSLRFRASSSACLVRAFASSGNRKTWTFSAWVKKPTNGTTQYLINTGPLSSSDSTRLVIGFNSSDKLIVDLQTINVYTTTQVFRDPSAWYHLVFQFDTTLATAGDRLRVYVNGSLVNNYDVKVNFSLNTDYGLNNNVQHSINRHERDFSGSVSSGFNDLYLAEINFIDGQALTPSSFGETDSITGRWKAKAYTGGYGVNGFYLNFSDNSGTTATTLGKDSAPISGTHTAANNWTPNNFSVSSGAGNDSLTDSPANYGTISTTLSADTYQISRSLRFNSADSAYLSRTPASAGNRKTWTWSGWIKRGTLGATQRIFTASNATTIDDSIAFLSSDALTFYFYNNSYQSQIVTTALFRDVSSWYHIIVSVDTTQATAANRIKFYVNGSEITSFSTSTYPTQNFDGDGFNTTLAHNIGRYQGNSAYFNGYLTEIHFIDGQALTPDSFGVRDASTYLWKPKAYTGTYGTNGFYLNFSDNSGTTATTLGKDQAGSNNWTPVNFSVASGVGNDSLVDTPTYYGTDAGAGGEARGDYCTLDPTPVTNGTFSQGNLRYIGPGTWKRANGTIAVSTGKWYYEVTLGNAPFSPRNSSSGWNAFGFGLASVLNSTTGANGVSDALTLTDSGYYTNFNGSGTDGGTAFSSGDVLSVAVDLDANTYTFRRNNTQIVTGTIGGTAGRLLTPCIISYDGQYGVMDVNFGQRPFAHAAPSGFRALRDYNKIPVPTGGVVRGNSAILNSLDNGAGTLSNGNLDLLSATASNWSTRYSSASVNSGKWYAEFTGRVNTSTQGTMVGVAQVSRASAIGFSSDSYGYRHAGDKWNNGSSSSYGATYTDNDVIGVALDLDNKTLSFYKNGNPQGIAFSSLPSGDYFFACAGYGTTTQLSANFGQRPWAYDAPFGFLPLCTTLLPTPAIKKPSSYMDVVTYTGNGSTQTISGLNFSPDLVWLKSRSSASWWHILVDSVRGAGRTLSSNVTNAEIGSGSDIVSSLNSNGFSLNVSPNATGNENGTTYVAWAWDQATIDGLDIVSYTGNGANRTIAHNLGVAPKMMIIKRRNTTADWCVYHTSTGAANRLLLSQTNASAADSTMWNSTEPTSSVFSVGTNVGVNGNNDTYIAYLFAEVEGFSKFGSYTGNGSADGPFVWCGFRPRYLMIKRTDVVNNWHIHDAVRDSFNVGQNLLRANTSDAEGSFASQDFTSNGFKLRTSDAGWNASGGTYIFCAFAESAFKYSRAR